MTVFGTPCFLIRVQNSAGVSTIKNAIDLLDIEMKK